MSDSEKIQSIRAKRTNYSHKRRVPQNKKVEAMNETTPEVDNSVDLDVNAVNHADTPPVFTVHNAPPNSIPDAQKQSAMEWIREKAGITHKPGQPEYKPTPITGDVAKAVYSVADVIASISSAILGWMFVLANSEYGYLLAPSKEVTYAVVAPLVSIYARHNKVVKEVSPDIVDLKDSLTALSKYIEYSWRLLQEIKKDKLEHGEITRDYSREPSNTQTTGYSNGNGPDKGKNGLASDYARRTALRRNSVDVDYGNSSNNGVGDDGYVSPVPTGDLTQEQRSAYDKLQLLSRRDYENRARRAGRL